MRGGKEEKKGPNSEPSEPMMKQQHKSDEIDRGDWKDATHKHSDP
jgi:hypothetical protein